MINNENRFKFLREKTNEELITQLQEEQLELIRCEQDYEKCNNFNQKTDIKNDMLYEKDVIDYIEKLLAERQNQTNKTM